MAKKTDDANTTNPVPGAEGNKGDDTKVDKPEVDKPGAPNAELDTGAGETVPKSKYVELQKAHNDLKSRFGQMETLVQNLNHKPILDALNIFGQSIAEQRGEEVAHRLQTYIENGNEQEAKNLAEREVRRQIRDMGLSFDAPELVNLKDSISDNPVQGFHQFLVMKPTLARLQVATPPVNNSGNTPAQNTEANAEDKKPETIGGKTLEELQADWAKQAMLTGAPPNPSGGGGAIQSLDPNVLFREGVSQQLTD